MNSEIEKIFVDLIKKELNLPDNYGFDDEGNEIPCVTIKSQNIKLFNTPKLQITVSTMSNNILSNRTEYKEINGQYHEHQYINEKRQMQIDVYSKNNDARQRFWEVQASLNSTFAQQLQDKYQFKIGVISNAVNISGLDGGSDINRYTIRFNVIIWHIKDKSVDYYNNFRTQARNKNDNIFANFTITENGVENNA